MLVITSYNASKIITPSFQFSVFELMVWNLELYVGRHGLSPFFSSMKLPKNKRSEYKKKINVEIFFFKMLDNRLQTRQTLFILHFMTCTYGVFFNRV